MKRKILFAGLAALLAFSPFVFGNGLNLNGVGARAVAMGGAFVGLADDYSAIFWNPAGLANMKSPSASLFGVGIMPSGKYKVVVPNAVGKYLFPGSTADTTVIDTTSTSKVYPGVMGAYIHPVSDTFVAGIGVYTPSGLGSDWDGSKMAFLSGNNTNINWRSMIGIVTIAPTIAYKVSDAVQVGAALNINYGMFDIAMYAGQADIPAFGINAYSLGQYEESETGWGVGATFGALFKPAQSVSFGFTFRTPFTIKFAGDSKISNLSGLGLGLPNDSTIERDVTWPMWIGAGVAFKPFNKLTVTVDGQWTQWSKIDELSANYGGAGWGPLMTMTNKNKMPMHWMDRMQIRFGAEFLATEALAVRAGYYIDRAPAPDRTMNILLPSYDFNGLTFGLGYSAGALRIDACLEYLNGAERTVDFLKVFTHPLIPNPLYDSEFDRAMPGVYNMTILAPSISITYGFGSK